MIAASLLALAIAADRPISRIAFGSCSRQTLPMPAYRRIAELKPELYLMLGDNIYIDVEKEDFDTEFAKLAANRDFQALRRTCPILAIYDDNDSGVNDGGVGNPHKQRAKTALLDFLGRPQNDPIRQQEGLYESRMIGPKGQRVQVITIDTRWFRSDLKKKAESDLTPGRYDPDPDPAKTMLGEVQWKWLRRQLLAPADLRIIASSVQVIPEDHKWEKWGNLPTERQRLFNLIKETGAEGVVFVSGDRHLGEISMMDAGVCYPLYDLTASAINVSFTDFRPLEPNRHRVGTLNVGHNFGLIEIDWSKPDPLIQMQIRTEDGESALMQRLPLSWLKKGRIK